MTRRIEQIKRAITKEVIGIKIPELQIELGFIELNDLSASEITLDDVAVRVLGIGRQFVGCGSRSNDERCAARKGGWVASVVEVPMTS